MTPNRYLLAFTAITTVAAVVWIYVVEPRIDAHRQQSNSEQLVNELEAWLHEDAE